MRYLFLFLLLMGIAMAQTPSLVVTAKSVTLSVSAVGTQPFTYQWYKNGVAIVGATNQTLVIATSRPTGTYYVIITNSVGQMKSGDVKLSNTTSTSASDITITRK